MRRSTGEKEKTRHGGRTTPTRRTSSRNASSTLTFVFAEHSEKMHHPNQRKVLSTKTHESSSPTNKQPIFSAYSSASFFVTCLLNISLSTLLPTMILTTSGEQ